MYISQPHGILLTNSWVLVKHTLCHNESLASGSSADWAEPAPLSSSLTTHFCNTSPAKRANPDRAATSHVIILSYSSFRHQDVQRLQRRQSCKQPLSEGWMSEVSPPSGLLRLDCVDIKCLTAGFCFIHAGPCPATETTIWPFPIDPFDHRLLLEWRQQWDSAVDRKQHNHTIWVSCCVPI